MIVAAAADQKRIEDLYLKLFLFIIHMIALFSVTKHIFKKNQY